MGLPSDTFKMPGIRETVALAIHESFSRVAFDVTQWTMEVRAIAQAAAVEGDYSIALEAYRMLGRHVGAVVDQKSAETNHLHLHGNMDDHARREASDEELQERMNQIRMAQAKLIEILPGGDDFFET